MRMSCCGSAVLMLLALTSCGEDKTATPTGGTPPAPGSSGAPPPPPSSANRAPTVEIYDFQPRSVALVGGTSVSFAARASDPDGDSLSYTWDFGDDEQPIENAGAGISHVFSREGEIQVKVTARDGRGGEASASTRIPTRKLSGGWRVDNARHLAITAEINHRNGPNFSGTMSDGATFTGTVSHPAHVTLRLNAANGLCIPSGTYNGDLNPDLDRVGFPGVNCRNFTLVRE